MNEFTVHGTILELVGEEHLGCQRPIWESRRFAPSCLTHRSRKRIRAFHAKYTLRIGRHTLNASLANTPPLFEDGGCTFRSFLITR
jgi:hypothetical protein